MLAPASYAVEIAGARPAALLARASSAGVFAPVFFAVVLADARPAASLALASYAVVLSE